MNNFTKEELICIRDNIVVPEIHNDKNVLLIAYHKLIGMIDNYCEYDINQCPNCGEIHE